MEIEDGCVELFGLEVGIDFGCGNARMPQHFLDKTEVGTVLQKVGSKGMPKGVRGDFLLDVGKQGVLFYKGENHHSGEGLACSFTQEEVVGAMGRYFYACSYAVDVVFYQLQGIVGYGYEAHLIAFAIYFYKVFFEIDIGDFEAYHLQNP